MNLFKREKVSPKGRCFNTLEQVQTRDMPAFHSSLIQLESDPSCKKR